MVAALWPNLWVRCLSMLLGAVGWFVWWPVRISLLKTRRLGFGCCLGLLQRVHLIQVLGDIPGKALSKQGRCSLIKLVLTLLGPFHQVPVVLLEHPSSLQR